MILVISSDLNEKSSKDEIFITSAAVPVKKTSSAFVSSFKE